jgi:hypothetical protein
MNFKNYINALPYSILIFNLLKKPPYGKNK